jgi:hypothetical protein
MMNMLVAIADKLRSNTKYDTQFKIPNAKKELLINKYKTLICETCANNVKVSVKESHCQAIV